MCIYIYIHTYTYIYIYIPRTDLLGSHAREAPKAPRERGGLLALRHYSTVVLEYYSATEDSGRNKKPNRTEPNHSGTGRNRTRNRTEPDRATTRPKNAGRTAKMTFPKRPEPNRINEFSKEIRNRNESNKPVPSCTIAVVFVWFNHAKLCELPLPLPRSWLWRWFYLCLRRQCAALSCLVLNCIILDDLISY